MKSARSLGRGHCARDQGDEALAGTPSEQGFGLLCQLEIPRRIGGFSERKLRLGWLDIVPEPRPLPPLVHSGGAASSILQNPSDSYSRPTPPVAAGDCRAVGMSNPYLKQTSISTLKRTFYNNSRALKVSINLSQCVDKQRFEYQSWKGRGSSCLGPRSTQGSGGVYITVASQPWVTYEVPRQLGC